MASSLLPEHKCLLYLSASIWASKVGSLASPTEFGLEAAARTTNKRRAMLFAFSTTFLRPGASLRAVSPHLERRSDNEECLSTVGRMTLLRPLTPPFSKGQNEGQTEGIKKKGGRFSLEE